MRKQAEVDTVVKDEQMRLIQDLQDFIKAQPTTITEFDRSNRSNRSNKSYWTIFRF
jgi:hypothetical protein